MRARGTAGAASPRGERRIHSIDAHRAEGAGFEPARREDPPTRFPGARTRPTMRPFHAMLCVRRRARRSSGGEGGIRTRGGSTPHRFSRSAPSTARTPLHRQVYARVRRWAIVTRAAATSSSRGDCMRGAAKSHGRLRVAVAVRYARRDLNPRPLGPQPNALSAELRAHVCARSMRSAEHSTRRAPRQNRRRASPQSPDS
jgi:hypothetical protein